MLKNEYKNRMIFFSIITPLSLLNGNLSEIISGFNETEHYNTQPGANVFNNYSSVRRFGKNFYVASILIVVNSRVTAGDELVILPFAPKAYAAGYLIPYNGEMGVGVKITGNKLIATGNTTGGATLHGFIFMVR